ncbi:PIG-L deacetylase family protein [Enemella sp. A6]|uniref:PIG-L deacetylase family protein n=1 Tax=Enemella sp. A6 TaxID=3440152 RepID=UPI003EBCE1B5
MPAIPSPEASPPDRAPDPVPWAQWHRALTDETLTHEDEAHEPFPFELDPEASWLVVAAHPDDEAIGAGRLIADHPGPISCLTLSAGEGCFGPSVDTDRVARTRLDEWGAAANELGMIPLETRQWPDGRLAEFENALTELLIDELADHDVLLAPWCHDPHPDHEAAGRAASRAAEDLGIPLLAYPVWTTYWLTPQRVQQLGSRLVTIPTSLEAEATRDAAVRCHRSQLEPRPPATQPVVPEELLRRHPTQLLVINA